ncbi:MAG: GGDEF domain-containing protein [Rhodoferax sp.]|jgi:diguanylate cyclase|nr:GGDEF domain-containing protein [Rhodoferax sp.]
MRAVSALRDLLLGTDSRMRLRLGRSLAAAGVGVIGMSIQFVAVLMGLTDATLAALFSVVAFTSLSLVYVALRTGWSLRFQDPAMTMPQMVLGIVALAAVYAINPAIRGMAMLIVAMSLVFGAFILPPARCRQLGWLAVAALGLVMAFSAWSQPTVFEPRIEAMHFMLAALVLPVTAYVAGELSAVRETQQAQKRELRAALDRLQQLATHDELTGLPNRRQMMELLALETRKATRNNTHLCFGLVDIDHFKQINDTLGHQAGDQTLVLFARLLSTALRAGDLLARWGGEEFLLLLPATSLDEAQRITERLRITCTESPAWESLPGCRVTFSAGLVLHRPGDSSALTIARADAALYAAKHAGRNQVVAESSL